MDYANWINPATAGLDQVSCRAGKDCGLRPPHMIVTIAAVDGYCANCAHKLGIKPGMAVKPGGEEQLRLEVH
jgi:hypothetical protein